MEACIHKIHEKHARKCGGANSGATGSGDFPRTNAGLSTTGHSRTQLSTDSVDSVDSFIQHLHRPASSDPEHEQHARKCGGAKSGATGSRNSSRTNAGLSTTGHSGMQRSTESADSFIQHLFKPLQSQASGSHVASTTASSDPEQGDDSDDGESPGSSDDVEVSDECPERADSGEDIIRAIKSHPNGNNEGGTAASRDGSEDEATEHKHSDDSEGESPHNDREEEVGVRLPPQEVTHEGGAPPSPCSNAGSTGTVCNPVDHRFETSATAQQHHDLERTIPTVVFSEDDMFVKDWLASISSFLCKDALAGGAAARDWVELMREAYPEWYDMLTLERSLACLLRRCQQRRAQPEKHRLVDSIEYWSGTANLTYAMVQKGNTCSRFDKKYSPAHDCATPAGLRLWFEELCCSAEMCFVWLGTVCSSHSGLCRAQSLRKASNGFLGDESRQFVSSGNRQMRVASLLYYISGMLGNITVLEQPVGSTLPRMQPLALVLQTLQCKKTVTWLGQFGAPSPKPLQLWHSHPAFQMLRRPRPAGLTPLTQRNGTRFTGKRQELAKSQEYTDHFAKAVAEAVQAARGH